jgi:EAL domain-containing protein (putative c-di-GMP-specific phosphodiesterase class I)
LWKFPFSKMKIDRSFMQALDTSPLVRGMLQSIIGLSKNLGLKITAEGIENTNHVNVLREFNCDYIQGYLTGKPAPKTELAAIILKNFTEHLRSPQAEHTSQLPKPHAINF